jgi:hypothetical protein
MLAVRVRKATVTGVLFKSPRKLLEERSEKGVLKYSCRRAGVFPNMVIVPTRGRSASSLQDKDKGSGE